jgi:hypothetical protein
MADSVTTPTAASAIHGFVAAMTRSIDAGKAATTVAATVPFETAWTARTPAATFAPVVEAARTSGVRARLSATTPVPVSMPASDSMPLRTGAATRTAVPRSQVAAAGQTRPMSRAVLSPSRDRPRPSLLKAQDRPPVTARTPVPIALTTVL